MVDLTPEEKETALQIAEDNQNLIDGLPEVGRKQLNNLLANHRAVSTRKGGMTGCA